MQISDNTLILYVLIFMLTGGAIGSWLTRLLIRYPFGQRPLTGKDAMIGKRAVVVGKKGKRLRVAINSQVWNAEAESPERIGIGERVSVVSVENLTLQVKPDEKAVN